MPGSESIPLTVVKVGGSLFDLPDLAQRLGNFIRSLSSSRVLLVPGGGAAADVVRELDRVHDLGDDAAHWIALRAASLNAHFLQALLPGSRLVCHPQEQQTGVAAILDALAFAQLDDIGADALPHDWGVTTDAVAARAAVVGGATRIILLKSVDWPARTRLQDAAAGYVDEMFPRLVEVAGLEVTWVNFRAWPATTLQTIRPSSSGR
jgi:5-(aminomethyl)-3-furanmethanol phosphate kinase